MADATGGTPLTGTVTVMSPGRAWPPGRSGRNFFVFGGIRPDSGSDSDSEPDSLRLRLESATESDS